MKIRALEIASVHKEILITEAFLRCVRTACKSAYIHNCGLSGEVDHFICHICSKNILNSEFQGLGRSEDINILSVMSKSEAYFRTCQGNADEF